MSKFRTLVVQDILDAEAAPIPAVSESGIDAFLSAVLVDEDPVIVRKRKLSETKEARNAVAEQWKEWRAWTDGGDDLWHDEGEERKIKFTDGSVVTFHDPLHEDLITVANSGHHRMVEMVGKMTGTPRAEVVGWSIGNYALARMAMLDFLRDKL